MEDFIFLEKWKNKMYDVTRLMYDKDQISDKEIYQYLDKEIDRTLNNRKVALVNNYTDKVSRMDILKLTDIIENNKLICAAAGCLFLPHGAKDNPLIDFITYIMDSRSLAKKERKKYEEGSYDWHRLDRVQNARKLVINMLYGCMGYPGFILFNIFIAECITSQGKHIITTAINTIEAFLGDAMYFNNHNDIINTIDNMKKAFHKKSKDGKLSDEFITMISEHLDIKNITTITTNRFLSRCLFKPDDRFKKLLYDIFDNMTVDELIVMYYKNNLIEFSKLPFMKNKYRDLIKSNGVLLGCEMYNYKDDTCRAMINEIWDIYDLFIYHDFPVYDRVRKAQYLDKKRSLYTDTDSVFLSVNGLVEYVFNDVFGSNNDSGLDKEDLTFTSANIALTLVNTVVEKALFTFCTSLNITEEYANMVKMKNEFFMSIVMFFDVKKRYIYLPLIQEGVLINDGKGKPKVSGLDFKKAGTKKFVQDFYMKICADDILYADVVNPAKIFMKMIEFKDYMETEILKGNTEFFKQSSVKSPEHYKNPYSTQGVNAIMLWNALCPEYAIDFPNDVNIVPVKDLTFPKPKKPTANSPVNRVVIKTPTDYKNIKELSELYPDRYENIFNTIYNNSNTSIRHMTLTSIAIPKNIDYEIPEHIKYVMDYSRVINNTIGLFLPVLKCLGLNPQSISSSEDHMSNIVEI